MTDVPDGCAEIGDLLGVYAIDALDELEARRVFEHLGRCPRCAQEVDEHRETIGMFAAAGGQAPPGVWEAIASAIEADRGPARPPLAPRLARRSPGGPARSPRRAGRPMLARVAAAAAAAAAVAAAALIGVQVVRIDHLDHRVSQLAAAARQSGGFQGAAAALVDPSAKHLVLTSTAGSRSVLGQLVILPSGRAYYVDTGLPALPPTSTYQLWSVVAGRAISVGLLGPHPRTVAFSVDPGVPTSTYLLTVEPAGGVVTPTAAPIGQVST